MADDFDTDFGTSVDELVRRWAASAALMKARNRAQAERAAEKKPLIVSIGTHDGPKKAHFDSLLQESFGPAAAKKKGKD